MSIAKTSIASSDHRIYLLQFAAAVMLTGLIFILDWQFDKWLNFSIVAKICGYFYLLD